MEKDGLAVVGCGWPARLPSLTPTEGELASAARRCGSRG